MNPIESIPEFYNNNTQYQKIGLPIKNTEVGHCSVFPRGYCKRT